VSYGFTHPSLGFSIELPPGAEVLDAPPGIALVAAEPREEAGDGFRANLVVTAEELPPDIDSAEVYTDASVIAQAGSLVDFRLIDRDAMTLAGGMPATRVLGHHDVDGQAVAVDQWCVVSGGRAYSVTASCWALDYDELADTFAASAETFVP
jgi:hypothetical protein